MPQHVLDEIDPKLLGERLQDARRAAGMTQQAVAEEMDMARTTVVAIEKGERRVSAHELVVLARLYGRSVSQLLNRTAVTQNFLPQFRASFKDDLIEQNALESIAAELQGLADDYLTLERMMNAPLAKSYPAQYISSGLPLDQAAEEIAAAERNRLGLGDSPLANLRQTLETDVGVRVFYFAMPSFIGGVFAFHDELGACIGINSRHRAERQNWSLAHEYGHFLTNRFSPEVMILKENKLRSSREQLAENFAKYFLMPSASLNRRFSDIHRSRNGQVTLMDICTLADLYHSSVQAIILRLEELRRLPSGTWDSLAARGFKPGEARRILGLADNEPERQLPARYEYLAFQAYRSEKLSEGQLARYLRADRVTARARLDDLSQRFFREDEGSLQTLTFDLAQSLTGKP